MQDSTDQETSGVYPGCSVSLSGSHHAEELGCSLGLLKQSSLMGPSVSHQVIKTCSCCPSNKEVVASAMIEYATFEFTD